MGSTVSEDTDHCLETRALATSASGASKQARDAQVLVGVWPVEIRPVTDDANCCTLLGRCMEETGKPCERNGESSPIDEAKDELIVRDLRVGRSCSGFNGD